MGMALDGLDRASLPTQWLPILVFPNPDTPISGKKEASPILPPTPGGHLEHRLF